MDITIRTITAASAHEVVVPTLVIEAEIKYYWGLQIPININGKLSIGSKCIALLHENMPTYHMRSEEMRLDQTPNTKNKWTTDKITTCSIVLFAELSPSAVDWIEQCREKSSDKSVRFDCKFLAKQLWNTGQHFKENINHEIVSMKAETLHASLQIEQSKWLREYAPALGIGKFLLIELKQRESANIPDWWEQVYANITKNLHDMEKHLKACEWQEVMHDARQFYENTKIGDEKGIYLDFKKEFNQYLEQDNHTEAGKANFYDGIWQFFEFTSKYVHNRDKQGHPVAKVIARKEDAYFVYSLALGLFNLITQKIETRKTSATT